MSLDPISSAVYFAQHSIMSLRRVPNYKHIDVLHLALRQPKTEHKLAGSTCSIWKTKKIKRMHNHHRLIVSNKCTAGVAREPTQSLNAKEPQALTIKTHSNIY